MCHFIIRIKNKNQFTNVFDHCCRGCLWRRCGCGQALPVDEVTIVANLNQGDHVHYCKRYNAYHTNKKVDQNRAKDGIRYTKVEGTQRQKPDDFQAEIKIKDGDVVKDEDEAEDEDEDEDDQDVEQRQKPNIQSKETDNEDVEDGQERNHDHN